MFACLALRGYILNALVALESNRAVTSKIKILLIGLKVSQQPRRRRNRSTKKTCFSPLFQDYKIILQTVRLPKPISNILSASSNTRNVTLVKFVAFILTKSIILPGVATTISAPPSNALLCSHLLPPP